MRILKLFEPLIILLFLAFVSASGLVSAAVFMGNPIDWVLVFSFACITFAIYCVNRYTDREDAINKKDHSSFFLKFEIILWISVILLVFSSALLLLSKKLTWYHVFITVVGLAYSVKIVPCVKDDQFLWTRLKDICIVKSVVVALIWGTSFFLINWCVYPEYVKHTLNLFMLMGNFSVATFTATVFTDIRDTEGDRIANVPTIPARFGITNTFKYAIVLPSLIFGLLSLILTYYHLLSIPMLCFFLINLCYPVVYVKIYYSGKCPLGLVEPLVDTCFVIFSLGLVLLPKIA